MITPNPLFDERVLISREREKTINVILFFAHKVNFLGKTKLFKLLYFLDFEHYRDTGRSVTGMEYFAWRMGPVPIALEDELNEPEADLCEKLDFNEIPVGGGLMLKITPLKEFDPTHFTPRELRIMERLAEEYRDAKAHDMTEATHVENQPWDRVYRKEGGKHKHIPYEYALRKQEEDAMREIVAERQEFARYFGEAQP
jgi:uncharacterized phage-associated protein